MLQKSIKASGNGYFLKIYLFKVVQIRERKMVECTTLVAQHKSTRYVVDILVYNKKENHQKGVLPKIQTSSENLGIGAKE